MWWAGSEVLDVYLGTRALLIVSGKEALLCRPVAGFDEGISELSSWLRSRSRRVRVRLWLSGGLCRPFVLALPEGISDEQELRKIAAVGVAELTGLNPPCRVWLDSARGEGAAIAVAVQEETLQRIEELRLSQAGKGLGVLSIRPWWAEFLRASLALKPDTDAVAVGDCDSLTILAGRGKHFDVASTLPSVMGRDATAAALARVMLRSEHRAEHELIGGLSFEPTSEGAADYPEWSGTALYPFLELGR